MKKPVTDNILFIELAGSDEDVLTPGKPFVGLAVGTFIGMSGYKSTVRKNVLPKMVQRTKELIQSTIAEDGELIGLPVDAWGHDHGDGAGWITDVALGEDKETVLFSVSWTEIGYELITKKIRRWFSATLSLAKNTIYGGTLTNWPAVRGQDGKYLLSPVQLSSGPTSDIQQITDDESFSTLSDMRDVQTAFYAEFGWENYSLEDYDIEGNYVVVRTDGKYYRVSFENKKGEVTFAEEADWKRIKKVWQDYVSSATNFIKSLSSRHQPDDPTTELEMNEETRNEITGLISTELTKALGPIQAALANLSAPAANPGDPKEPKTTPDVMASIRQIVNLDGMNAELAASIETLLAENFEAVNQAAQADYAKMLAETKVKGRMTTLCANLTQGTPQNPRGLPLDQEELRNHLMALNPAEREYFSTAFQTIWQSGFQSFEELGHQQEVKGTRELPADILADLRSGALSIADLSNPILAPAIGDLSEYNLSEFVAKEA